MIVGTGKYADRIEDRFEHASSKLLRIMLEDGDLKARLSSMKSYFLLARGDFLMHFLVIAEEQLVKEVEDIRQSQLQTILDLAVRSSSAVNDEHAEELLASIEGHGLLRRLVDTDDEASLREAAGAEELVGFDAFVLFSP